MANKLSSKTAVKFLKDCDDMVELITGKRIKDFVRRGINLYGEELKRAAAGFVLGKEEELASDNPYRVLGCRPDADDLVVKGKYRQLVFKYHPDTGSAPDAKAFQAVVEAYNAIDEARKKAKEGKQS